MSCPDSAKDSGFVLVYPFFLKTPESSRSWLDRNLGAVGGFFSGVNLDKIQPVRPVPDETAVRFRRQKSDMSCEGMALCSIYEKSGVLYVAGSRAGEFESQKPRLLAILKSFRFGLPEKRISEPPKPKIRYAAWQDPMERAFTLDVPAGWQVQGGTFRRASVDLVHVINASSPDGRIQIRFNDADIPIFVIPNQALLWSGFREGSWYSPEYGVRMMVRSYRPGFAFLLDYLQSSAGAKPGFALVERKERPDIVQEFNRIYSASQAYGVSFQLHAGDAAFRFSQAGDPFVGYGLAVTQVVQSAAMGGGNWSAALLLIYTCPESEAGTVREAATHMFQSVRMNPQWVAGQQQLAANVSQIVTQTNQAVSDIISDSYWTRQGALDSVHRKFSNYILGVTDVADPETGETYKVEAGHNYYWIKSGSGQVEGTETFTRPDIDFSPLEEF